MTLYGIGIGLLYGAATLFGLWSLTGLPRTNDERQGAIIIAAVCIAFATGIQAA